MMKKILTFLKWSAIVLLGVPVLLYLLWLSGNLYKEDLSPEVSRLLTRQPDLPLAEKDNAYFDVIGLSAPSSMDPHSWGVAWFAQASANDLLILDSKPANPIQLANYPAPNKLPSLPCSKADSQFTCLEEVAKNPAVAQSELDDESLLLTRFDDLLDKEYQEPYRQITLESAFPQFAPLGRATKLAQTRIALEIANHRDDDALKRWERETRFLLRLTKNSHSLIDILVSTAILNRYQQLLANYIGTYPERARGRKQQLLALLEPFSKSALTLQHAMENEAAIFSRSFRNLEWTPWDDTVGAPSFLGKIVGALAYPLFDKAESANEHAIYLLEYARIASLDGDAYREGLAIMAKRQERIIDERFSFHYHNPVGKLIASIAEDTDYFSGYLYRVDDVIANKNLLVFAINLLANAPHPAEQIAQSLLTQGSALAHPFTGSMPEWNEKTRTLSYAAPEAYKKNNPPMQIHL